MPALRLAAVSLTTPEPRESARFYRWCLDLKPVDETSGDRLELSWGREDRVLLATPEAPGGEESLLLRMSARPLEAIAAWCRESGVDPESVRVPPEDEERARESWPGRPVEIASDETTANRVQVRVRGPGGLAIELVFPLPKEVVVERGRSGPFAWRSRDWSGLEIPGLLGVRTGVTDPAAVKGFAAALGIRPMEESDTEPPLAIGDHQWILEAREEPGVYGLAVVVSAARLGAIQRTLAHMGVQHRLDGSRLLAADPGGRIVLIHGVREG